MDFPKEPDPDKSPIDNAADRAYSWRLLDLKLARSIRTGGSIVFNPGPSSKGVVFLIGLFAVALVIGLFRDPPVEQDPHVGLITNYFLRSTTKLTTFYDRSDAKAATLPAGACVFGIKGAKRTGTMLDVYIRIPQEFAGRVDETALWQNLVGTNITNCSMELTAASMQVYVAKYKAPVVRSYDRRPSHLESGTCLFVDPTELSDEGRIRTLIRDEYVEDEAAQPFAQNGYVEAEDVRPMRFYDLQCYSFARSSAIIAAPLSKDAPETPPQDGPLNP